MERFEGDNKLTCDDCNEKTDSLKGIKISRLPAVITFCLFRFELDYETFQRKKLNDRFEYPLEVNLAEYLDEQSIIDNGSFSPDSTIYELKSIIIHRGSAHGGHYHAYIQDELKEGNWHLTMPEQFIAQPKPIEKKKEYDPKDFMTTEQIREMEIDKNNDNPDLSLKIDIDKKGNGNNNQTNKNKKKQN